MDRIGRVVSALVRGRHHWPSLRCRILLYALTLWKFHGHLWLYDDQPRLAILPNYARARPLRGNWHWLPVRAGRSCPAAVFLKEKGARKWNCRHGG